MGIYYVYAYFEPDGANPFYIGKGHGQRHIAHLEPAYFDSRTPFYKKLKNLRDQGIVPEIHFMATELSEAQAMTLERKLIALYGRLDKGGCLMNLTDGGDGPSGYICSPERRLKMSIAGKKKPPKTQYERDCASARMKANNIGKEYSKSKRQPIVCFLGLTIVKRYESIKSVLQDGYNNGAVRNALISGKEAYGFFWEYDKS